VSVFPSLLIIWPSLVEGAPNPSTYQTSPDLKWPKNRSRPLRLVRFDLLAVEMFALNTLSIAAQGATYRKNVIRSA